MILPSSFFPAMGGAQGSLLNFIYVAEYKRRPVLLLGTRAFLFSLFKAKNFIPLPFPYFLVNSCPYLGILYAKMVGKIFSINTVLLYGGGATAAIFLKYKLLFKNTKFIIRSAGEDIQVDKLVKYGANDKITGLINKYYKNCDIAWALSSEIEKLYLKKCKIPADKIIVCPNAIIQRDIIAKPQQPRKNQKLHIGVIGRNHPKKQFSLAYSVAKINPEHNFIFKTPGFSSKILKNTYFLEKTVIKDLLKWPQSDVQSFYHDIDLLLVCSRVESFGNINFEAAINGIPVLIHRKVTGGEILLAMGYKVFFFDSFNIHSISKKIEEVKNLINASQYNVPDYDNSQVIEMANF